MLPYASLDIDPEDNLALSANDGHLGDILVEPSLQWDPVIGPNGPKPV